MKKILSLLIALVMLVSVVALVSADELPEDYMLYGIDGMQRVLASSSIIDKNTDLDSSLLFDHRTGTSLTFDFADKDTKGISLIIGSRDCEKVEKLAMLIDHDEETVVEVSLFVTNDPEFKTWMKVGMTGEKSVATDEENTEFVEENDDGWKVLNVAELNQGFAFYRIDFDMESGESFTLTEIALFRTEEAEPEAEPAAPKTLVEKEPWRKALALTKGRLF